jgi:hypothetical protein
MDHTNPIDILGTDAVSAYADARSENSVSQPEPLHELAGDHADDDGQALAEYFQVNPNGAGQLGEEDNPYDDLYKNSQHSGYSDQSAKVEETPTCTRIISRNITMNNGDFIQVFARDPKRKNLTITYTSTTEIPCPILMSEKGSVADVGNQGYGLVPTEVDTTNTKYFGVYQFDGHTGAIWIYYPGFTALNITVLVVTE